ncbi:hypothetical protein PBV87_00070 [Niameybacter massiliensis]|uniref:Uncharacterized protein n=1 Tax=Holtiella tumoricola TaxID=3018743 RepID=A0AA42DJ62_9FIRM|nr:hypothetical protein [Holtiella tumoricola]MDA3729907.1 hypothetical protein [Holtiella tumoricola]
MDAQELLIQVNQLLETGLKVSEVEKKLGYGDGQARKLLSKAGFKCDRKLNKYVPKDGEVQTLEQVVKPIEEKPQVTRSNGVMPRQEPKQELTQKQVFTGAEVDILHKLIQEYQVRQLIQSETEEDKGKTINRNVRVYEKQFDSFATWCKENNVTQADALYRAIDLMMKTFK